MEYWSIPKNFILLKSQLSAKKYVYYQLPNATLFSTKKTHFGLKLVKCNLAIVWHHVMRESSIQLSRHDYIEQKQDFF